MYLVHTNDGKGKLQSHEVRIEDSDFYNVFSFSIISLLSILFNEFEFCPKCGCINDGCIIKKGCEKSLIKINKISEITSYLELRKQVYKCKNCNHKWEVVPNSLLNGHGCHICNRKK